MSQAMDIDRRPCNWGCRLPLHDDATADDALGLVDEVHGILDAASPDHDYHLHLLGIGELTGRLPRRLAGLGPLIIVTAYKLRQPHIDALLQIAGDAEQPPAMRRLAVRAVELDRRPVRCSCDARSTTARGGGWMHHLSSRDAIDQEDAAWAAVGASVVEARAAGRRRRLAAATAALAALVAKHGPGSPRSWSWGEGTSLPDVFAADEAVREYRAHKETAATMADALAAISDEPSPSTGGTSTSSA